MAADNEALVRSVIEALIDKKQAGLFSAMYAPDCEGSSPDGPMQGWDGFNSFFDKYNAAFPDFRVTVNYLLSAKDRVVVHYTFLGTHTGPLAGYPATGRTAWIGRRSFRRLVLISFPTRNL